MGGQFFCHFMFYDGQETQLIERVLVEEFPKGEHLVFIRDCVTDLPCGGVSRNGSAVLS